MTSSDPIANLEALLNRDGSAAQVAATLVGAQLTAAHRSAQLALRAVTLRQVLQVLPAFDPEHAARS